MDATCLHCGYDLTGLIGTGPAVCPECGREVIEGERRARFLSRRAMRREGIAAVASPLLGVLVTGVLFGCGVNSRLATLALPAGWAGSCIGWFCLVRRVRRVQRRWNQDRTSVALAMVFASLWSAVVTGVYLVVIDPVQL